MMSSRLALGAGIAVVLAGIACGGTVQSGTGSAGGNVAQVAAPATAQARVPGLPDGSFEKEPSEWQLGPNAVIDAAAAHDGKRSLRIELDRGLGSDQVTRSAYFIDIDVGREYVLTFQYRYERCKSAVFTLHVGDYEKKLRLDGSESKWTKGSVVVSFAKKPAWVDVTAGRMGSADQYAAAEHDDNVLWLDDLAIAPK